MKQLAAVIIENRKYENFGQLCKEHLDFLPSDTDLFVFTSEELVVEYQGQLNNLDIVGKFHTYPTDVKVPENIRSINGFTDLMNSSPKMPILLNYCLFMTQPLFWQTFLGYERILTFQMDTVILRNGIEEFMEWDYVGAPCYNFFGDNTIQNGGLSLRNPRIMEYICRYYGWNSDLEDLIKVGQYSTANFFAEDIFFSLRMIKHKVGNFAPIEVAKRFSVESKLEWGTFGGHRLEHYFEKDVVSSIRNQYKK
jgi:hypothetical protein